MKSGKVILIVMFLAGTTLAQAATMRRSAVALADAPLPIPAHTIPDATDAGAAMARSAAVPVGIPE